MWFPRYACGVWTDRQTDKHTFHRDCRHAVITIPHSPTADYV